MSSGQILAIDSPDRADQAQSDGRSGPRSRTGCWTCRAKKVKCDEQRPTCKRCVRLKRLCDYAPRQKVKKQRGVPLRESQGPASIELPRSPGLVVARQSAERPRSPASWYRRKLQSLRLISIKSEAACSLMLSSDDHEAIRYFQTSLATFGHTKNPKFSLYSIMFRIAEDDAMVMHMVIALAGREIEYLQECEGISETRKPVLHYSNALRMMAEAIEQEGIENRVDSILTTLLLMLMYEQRFGDRSGVALSNHLSGATSFLQHRCRDLLQLPAPSFENRAAPQALINPYHSSCSPNRLSLYSARTIAWISGIDATAASCGLGGQFNAALLRAFSKGMSENDAVTFSPIDKFSQMHRFSSSLYRTMWGDSYPQAELLDDVENRTVFGLRGECTLLRFMIASLASPDQIDDATARKRISSVEREIRQVGIKHAELMEVASELSIDTNHNHRLVANIRCIVPLYYAAVLEFLRITRFDQPLDGRQRHALRETMNLAFQAFQYEGEQATSRIAWPLFIAALETDDLLHRDWVMNRFQAMSKLGKNYKRAHSFLVDTIALQGRLGRRVDIRKRFKSGELEPFAI